MCFTPLLLSFFILSSGSGKLGQGTCRKMSSVESKKKKMKYNEKKRGRGEEEEEKTGSEGDHFLPVKQDVSDEWRRVCGSSEEKPHTGLHMDLVRFIAPCLDACCCFPSCTTTLLAEAVDLDKRRKEISLLTSHSFFVFIPLM